MSDMFRTMKRKSDLPDLEEKIALLRKCDKDYETSGKSELTDPEYDKLYYEVQAMAPDHEYFDEVGGLDEGHIYGTKVKHDVIMGSLNKSKDVADFFTWFKSTYNTPKNEVLVQHKVDGLSLTCIYTARNLSRVVTRGDGTEGIDVTKNAVYIGGIPTKIKEGGIVEVRGECFKDREDFYENWVGEYANPRNFTAGAVNQKDPKVTKERGVSFVAYEVVRKEFKKEFDKIAFLKENKFQTLESTSKVFKGTAVEIAEFVKKYMASMDRDKLPYDVDGVVVKLNDVETAKEMGSTSNGRKPRAHRAVKFACDQVITKLNGIEWAVGRTGSLSIVGLLSPVQLAGTTVQRVTLHNVKFVKEMNLKIDSEILIQKSGDIIPYIVKKISDGNADIDFPTVCPSCGNAMRMDDNNVNLWCFFEDCQSKIVSKIDYWFKTIGVKGIGESIVTKVVSNAEVNSVNDFYSRITKNGGSWSSLFGAKAYANILEAMDGVKEVDLPTFIKALGIGQIGTMAKDIVGIAPTIEDLDKLTVAQVEALDGFANKKASNFVNGWANKRDEIGSLLKRITIKEQERLSSKLKDKTYCFTGSFQNPSRKEMESMVGMHGGRLASVSKKLTALVWDGEIDGSKVDKAKANNVPIIRQSDFMELIKGD